MKPAALHIPGLELAESLLAENASPRDYAEKLEQALTRAREEALAQAIAACERGSRHAAPLDYAQPAQEHPAIERNAPPRDYVPVVEAPFHPSGAVSTKGKLVVSMVGAFMAWSWIPRVFADNIGMAELGMNVLLTAFYLFMFGYPLICIFRDLRKKYFKASPSAKDAKNGKAVSDTHRSA